MPRFPDGSLASYTCLNCGVVPVLQTRASARRLHDGEDALPGEEVYQVSNGYRYAVSPRTCNRCGAVVDEGTWSPRRASEGAQ